MSINAAATFQLFLFHTHLDFDLAALAAGVDGLVIDWESRGKQERQRDYDTQINKHSLKDLRLVRSATTAPVICRLNSLNPSTGAEVDAAVTLGATEVLLPMVRTMAEAEQFLALVSGRCGCGIMLETLGAVQVAAALARLPLTRVYVGLNDLSIERRDPHLFAALADATVEYLRRDFGSMPFGFGGLTAPDLGYPLPCRALISEMVRLGSNFSFLRRSFVRDAHARDLVGLFREIRAALAEAGSRTAAQIAADRIEMLALIERLPAPPWAPN